MPAEDLYSFPVKTIKGSETTLSEYKGKVMLIVNVASRCMFTPQYTSLEVLQQKFQKQGFEVLGFPCNQFREQEPGTDEDIRQFCDTTYKVTFPLFSKIEVNGDETHPIYKYLKSHSKGFLGTEAIKWNFTKFLVGRNGKVLRRYAPTSKPETLESEIEAALKDRE